MEVVTSESDRPSEARDLRRVLALFKGHRRYALLQVTFSVVEGFCEAAILTLFARLAIRSVSEEADSVFVPGVGDRSTSFALCMLVALVVARFFMAGSSVWFANRLQFRLVRTFRENAVKNYTEASWTAQDQMDHGALQQLIITLPNGIGSNLSGLISYLGQFSIMCAMLVYALFTDAKLTALLVVAIGLSTFLFRPLRKWIRKRSARALTVQQELSHAAAEVSSMKFELQAFRISQRVAAPLLQSVEEEASVSEKAGRLRGTIVPTFTTFLYLAVTFGLVVLAQGSGDDLDQTGPILLVVLRSLSYGVSIQQAASGISVVMPLIEAVSKQSERLEISHRKWGHLPLEKCVSLEFENVNFLYPGSAVMTLEEINATFEIGGKIGIVGPSGGGKTTLVRLALGVVDPTSGKVLLNGSDLRRFDQRDLARKITVVPQAAAMLRGTIAFNLAFFRDGISEDAMWEALRFADLEGEIQRLPNGLNTIIGTGHLQLSGGQQQRLAIARAFVGRPELVVMDEPTSSVDALSEAAISQAISNLPAGVTVLIVSHRMRILEGCQQLIVVQDGRISAMGTPDEILTASEYARRMDLR